MIDKTFNIDNIDDVKEIAIKVLDLYCNQLLGLNEVAAALALNVNTVRKILSDNNIELRQRNFRK